MKDGVSYALKLLGQKDYFAAELKEKIARKFGYAASSEAIEKLKEWGYLNDERAFKNYVSSKFRAGYGAYYISSKLYQKSVEASISEIEEIARLEEIDKDELIRKLAAKYIEDEFEDSYKQFAKCISFLQNRGFSLQECLKIVKKGDFER